MPKKHEFRVPALEVRQGPNQRLYSFAVDGKRVHSFATVSRIKRSKRGDVLGYQRPEVISHIAEIRNYLESKDPMIPNAVVVAFDNRVKFEPATKSSKGYTRVGTLIIPTPPNVPDEDKVGWIVDGQQRLAAIREAEIDEFPLCVIAFVADDVVQREQFILVNATKPLPKGLIYELLPTTEAQLPSLLQRRRFPTSLLSRLNMENSSPLKGMIKTPTNPDGVIKDNSILKMIENSLSDGILYRYRGAPDEDADSEGMMRVLEDYWAAVETVFPAAWGETPKRSRLMHGAGIVSMGFLMDAISDRYREQGIPTRDQFEADLVPMGDACRWTDGYWDFGPGKQRKWNEIQNTGKDIQLLANHLLINYKARIWNRSTPAPN